MQSPRRPGARNLCTLDRPTKTHRAPSVRDINRLTFVVVTRTERTATNGSTNSTSLLMWGHSSAVIRMCSCLYVASHSEAKELDSHHDSHSDRHGNLKVGAGRIQVRRVNKNLVRNEFGRSDFDINPDHVGFTVDEVVFRQVFLRELSPVRKTLPMLNTHSFTYHRRCIIEAIYSIVK